MKKLLLILIILFCFALSSDAKTTVVNIVKSGTVANTCSWLGSAQLGWNGDQGTDVNACVQAGTYAATLVADATISTDQNYTPGGAYALDILGNDDYLQFSITSGNYFASAEGYIDLYYFPDAHSSTQVIFETRNSSANYMYIYYSTAQKIGAVHVGNSVNVTLVTAGTLTDDQWNHVEVRWSQASNIVSIKLNDGDWENDADDDAVTTFTAEPATFKLGENQLGSSYTLTSYIDNFRIWNNYAQN